MRLTTDLKFQETWKVDFGAIMKRVHRLQAVLSPHDAALHFKQLGIDVFLGEGHFTGSNQLEVGGQRINFKKALIVTGTQPIPLEIQGLNASDYHTNQTIFELSVLPKRLGVIGGGPISCELSQAFLRFGSEVTLITSDKYLLPKDDREASKRLRESFEKEGMRILTETRVQRVEKNGAEKILYVNDDQKIVVDEILVAIGRAPAVEGLNLEQAGVDYDVHHGIQTNEYLQTTNLDIYAAGDVTSKYKFTHISVELSAMAVKNALRGEHEKKSALHVPWSTFTDPEIAHIGVTNEVSSSETALVEMANVDRAIVDEETVGFVKLQVKAYTDQIASATIMATHAGDMIAQVGIAMASKNGLTALAEAIHPFPTQSQSVRMAAQTILNQRETVSQRR